MLTLAPEELVIDNPANRLDCWFTAASVMDAVGRCEGGGGADSECKEREAVFV